MKVRIKKSFLYPLGILIIFTNCFVCCPKERNTTAFLNLHFDSLAVSDTVYLHYLDQNNKKDTAVFAVKEGKPVTVTFKGYDNSLGAIRDYIIVDVPNAYILDTLKRIKEDKIDQGCGEEAITRISVEKDGAVLGPEESIDIHY